MKTAFFVLFLSLGGLQIGFSQATLRAGDNILLIARGLPQAEMEMLNGSYRIDNSGMLQGLPYLEGRAIRASGRTEVQVAQAIQAAYRSAEIYTTGTFTINADGQEVDRMVTVSGRAVREGPVKYFPGMNLQAAVSAAGGPHPQWGAQRVRLIRDGRQPIEYDLRKDQDKTVSLQPGDIVEVQRRGAFE
ncbi:MAG: hypothetical protein AAF555_08550 [Verrucomicrobiota bacterium]